jgi:hypothetical protein
LNCIAYCQSKCLLTFSGKSGNGNTVFELSTACSKRKRASVATVPELCLTTVNILTPPYFSLPTTLKSCLPQLSARYPRLPRMSRVQNLLSFLCVRTYIQRRDSMMTWSVILSVHGADPLAEVKLLISPFLR